MDAFLHRRPMLPTKVGCSELALVRIPGAATPRAWQLLETDGRRTQVWRTPAGPALYSMLRPAFDSLPPAFKAARGTALGINPTMPSLELLRALKAAAAAVGGLAAAETFCPAASPLSTAALRELVTACDVFSVNQLEAASMLGRSEYSAHDMVIALLGAFLVCYSGHSYNVFLHADAGAACVALRMGAQGSLVGNAEAVWQVPAYLDVKAVDPTGCGNAYLGALMACLVDEQPLPQAGAWGAAAASCMLEVQGLPSEAPAALHALAAERQAALMAGTVVA